MLEGDGEEPHQDWLGGHEKGNVRVSEHEISLGREGVQHWTQARHVQCNFISGRSEACHLECSVIGSRQCGLLRKSLYHTRDAAQNWECELGGFLEEIGLRRGQASTCLYSEGARGIGASVHSDDVTVIASREDPEWLIRMFKERYEIKTQMIGEAADLDKQFQILNRKVRWSPRGLWIEADPRHVKEMIRALGLEGVSPAPTLGVAAKGETRVEDNEDSTDPELGREEATMFRAVAARLNYLSQDRPDITFATMKLCSKMSRPDAQDLKNVQRVGRFLFGRPRLGCLFEWPAHPSALHAIADADWAGDRQCRKSVSGGMILHGKQRCRNQHCRSRTVRWQPCSNRVDGVVQRCP